MTRAEVLKIFERKGWKVSKDEVDDDVCELPLGNLGLFVVPQLRTSLTGQKLTANSSVSDPEFSKTVATIFDKTDAYYPVQTRIIRKKSESLDERDVEALIEEVIDWGKSVSVDDAIKQFSSGYSSRPGQLQLYHLAALAIQNNKDTLIDYLRHFERGERLNFVPMIKTEMIKRALRLADSRGQFTDLA